ncbi:hypothetical protein P153DRAFT_288031 [Dothidotthia symphoricarpi CBS 119687]|uniref:Uncharacterized protein n=1 Tax=Dothidotthia symphoricarpi CBS 119687 TaxID=1392245 RepID=A0A6A6AJC5_9PLEO|nr:uncharacterized protein P153DRAFT_288031 [Dothidotthia symphoricarpi CBS 119687]KAF2131208.1 hypothetical protein P153DRAFT_288031 [Dothidotthia symphoricarpi CBS 119687]
MTPSSTSSTFKSPPTVHCLCRIYCLGIGRKVYRASQICPDCLKRHDPEQLCIWANNNPAAIHTVSEEVSRKQVSKQNIEAHGRYLCAFEDPDYRHCRWRRFDLNLRGTRLDYCTKLESYSTLRRLGCMLPPPPKSRCAFGVACASSPEGQELGRDICSWCKNMSIDALLNLADTQPDSQYLRHLVCDYMHQVERDNKERVSKGWSYLCACKDPEYRFHPWRRAFNPKDARLCGTVRHRGQLCTRCYAKATEQACPWLAEFDGDRLGFPCVFMDPHLRRPVDSNWKMGPVDAQGRHDPNWETDPRRHARCERARLKNQLCQKCFNRMCEIRGFGRYFDPEWGTLRGSCGL